MESGAFLSLRVPPHSPGVAFIAAENAQSFGPGEAERRVRAKAGELSSPQPPPTWRPPTSPEFLASPCLSIPNYIAILAPLRRKGPSVGKESLRPASPGLVSAGAPILASQALQLRLVPRARAPLPAALSAHYHLHCHVAPETRRILADVAHRIIQRDV